jgi:hypothetical protein
MEIREILLVGMESFEREKSHNQEEMAYRTLARTGKTSPLAKQLARSTGLRVTIVKVEIPVDHSCKQYVEKDTTSQTLSTLEGECNEDSDEI